MQENIVTQMMDFHKTAFDTGFDAMMMMQDHAEKTMNMILDTGLWPVPEEGKRIWNEWFDALRKGREEFKKALDESYVNLGRAVYKTTQTETPGEEPQRRSQERREQAVPRTESPIRKGKRAPGQS